MFRKKGHFEKQKSNNIGRDVLAILLVCVACGVALILLFFNNKDESKVAIPIQSTADVTMPAIVEMTAEDHYEPVLEKYRRSIAEGWSKEQCEIEGISLRMEAGSDFTKAGYAFLDLDGDGREELLIAEESVPHIDNIWDLYTTLEDGTPIQLWVDERDGNQCKLYEGNVIGTEYTTKTEAEYGFYRLEAGQLVMLECLQYEDEDTVFHTDAKGNTRQVTSKEAQDIAYTYDTQKLDLIWLADIPNDLRDTDAVERYTPILEKYRTALTENWDPGKCMDNDVSRMVGFYGDFVTALGYTMIDLDSNGIQELIITDGLNIFDMYTHSAQEPVHIISASERITYTLKEGNVIYNRGSGGAVTTLHVFYRVEDDKLMVHEAYIYDAYISPDAPWFFSDGIDYGDPCGDFDAQTAIDAYKTIEIPFTPFE